MDIEDVFEALEDLRLYNGSNYDSCSDALHRFCEAVLLVHDDELNDLNWDEMVICIQPFLSQLEPPAVRLLAMRACTNMISRKARSTSALLVEKGAIPVLCSTLLEGVEFIDLAEQTVLCLAAMISANQECHISLVVFRAGGFGALFQFLDFFTLNIQKKALETAQKMIQNVADQVESSMINETLTLWAPALALRAQHGDAQQSFASLQTLATLSRHSTKGFSDVENAIRNHVLPGALAFFQEASAHEPSVELAIEIVGILSRRSDSISNIVISSSLLESFPAVYSEALDKYHGSLLWLIDSLLPVNLSKHSQFSYAWTHRRRSMESQMDSSSLQEATFRVAIPLLVRIGNRTAKPSFQTGTLLALCKIIECGGNSALAPILFEKSSEEPLIRKVLHFVTAMLHSKHIGVLNWALRLSETILRTFDERTIETLCLRNGIFSRSYEIAIAHHHECGLCNRSLAPTQPGCSSSSKSEDEALDLLESNAAFGLQAWVSRCHNLLKTANCEATLDRAKAVLSYSRSRSVRNESCIRDIPALSLPGIEHVMQGFKRGCALDITGFEFSSLNWNTLIGLLTNGSDAEKRRFLHDFVGFPKDAMSLEMQNIDTARLERLIMYLHESIAVLHTCIPVRLAYIEGKYAEKSMMFLGSPLRFRFIRHPSDSGAPFDAFEVAVDPLAPLSEVALYIEKKRHEPRISPESYSPKSEGDEDIYSCVSAASEYAQEHRSTFWLNGVSVEASTAMGLFLQHWEQSNMMFEPFRSWNGAIEVHFATVPYQPGGNLASSSNTSSNEMPRQLIMALSALKAIYGVSKSWHRLYSQKTSDLLSSLLRGNGIDSMPSIIPSQKFISATLDRRLVAQLEDIIVVCAWAVPSCWKDIAKQFPFVLGLDTRKKFLSLCSFDNSIAYTHIYDQLKSQGIDVMLDDSEMLHDVRGMGLASTSQFLRKKTHGQPPVHRGSVLQHARRLLLLHARTRAEIRVEFAGEAGVGLGPTDEYFSILCKELCIGSNRSLWNELGFEEDEASDSPFANIPNQNTNQSEPRNGELLTRWRHCHRIAVVRCSQCGLTRVPHCEEHSCLFTEQVSHSQWDCPHDDCSATTLSASWASCISCQAPTDVISWILDRREIDYLRQVYPKTSSVIPAAVLQCDNCGATCFPGSDEAMCVFRRGLLVDPTQSIPRPMKELSYRSVLKHILPECSQAPLTVNFAILHSSVPDVLHSSIPATPHLVQPRRATTSSSLSTKHISPRCSLFPSPQQASRDLFERKRMFTFVGRLIGTALLDSRVLDLPLSLALFEALQGVEPLSIWNVADAFPTFGRSCLQLHRKETEDSGEGSSLMQLGLSDTLPGYDFISLLDSKGASPKLISEYVDRIWRMLLVETVDDAVVAMRQGLSEVLCLEDLAMFLPNELHEMICGSGEHWDFSIEQLKLSVLIADGFAPSSTAVQFLFEILSELSSEDRVAFIRFVTGCVRLPQGGLTCLQPPLKIVRVPFAPSENKSAPLLSSVTCTHTLRLVDYPSKSMMHAKLMQSIHECPWGFQLS